MTNSIHALLQQPEEVSVATRDALIKAYEAIPFTLSNGFNNTSLRAPNKPITLTYLSDNGGGFDDTAPTEIDTFFRDSINAVSVLSNIARPDIAYHNTPAQAWIQSGFDLAQSTRYSLTGAGKVTFLNCAPRIDERGQDGNTTNKGEPIYVGILPNGHIISANSRYNFWAFEDLIESGELEVFEANVQTDGTQFRSRDIFPTHAAILTNLATQNLHLWKPEMSAKERRQFVETLGYIDTSKPLTADNLPTVPQFTVAQVDVHGNVKLNTRLSELDEDTLEALRSETFDIHLNGLTLPNARFTERMFDRAEGEPGLSTGSSGSQWIGADNQDGFLEVSIIGGSAASKLGLSRNDFTKPATLKIPGINAAPRPQNINNVVHLPVLTPA